MKERTATFTVEIPVRFTFKASAKTDSDVLLQVAAVEAQRRLYNADVEYKNSEIGIVNKEVEYTAEDRAEENAFWAKILGAKI